MFGTDPISELNLQLFGIQSVPGKGKGLVARFNIAKGQRISAYAKVQRRARRATRDFFRSSQNKIYYRQTCSGPILLEKALIDKDLHALYACLELR